MTKILITGNEGFVGSYCETFFRADGYEVRGVDRKFNNDQDLLNYNKAKGFWADMIYWNPDVIIHLAGTPRIQRSIKDPINTFNDNVVGTRNILELARKMKPKLFIYAGSSSSKGMPQNPYSWQKLMGEMLCKSYEQTYGINTCCVTFHNVFHEQQTGVSMETDTLLGIWRQRFLNGKPCLIYGSGDQRRDFTHVRDVYTAMRTIITQSVRGNIRWSSPIDIGNGKNYSVNEIKNFILEVNKSVKFEYREPKQGEQDVTLADITTLLALGWKPEMNVPEAIKRAFIIF